MACLEALLQCTLRNTADATVIVSSSTAVLDLAAALCAKLGAQTARIDGSTDPAQRHDIVSGFNAAHSRARVRRKPSTGGTLAACRCYHVWQ